MPRPRFATAIVAVGGVVGAVLLGLLTAITPAVGVAAVALIAATYVFSRNGLVAVCAFTAATYFEITDEWTSATFSAVKVTGAALAIVAAATLIGRARPRFAAASSARRPAWFDHPVIVAALTAYVALGAASAGWAEDVSQVVTLTVRLVTIALVFLAVPVFVTRPQHVRALGWTMLAASATSIGVGVLIGATSFERAIGAFYDPNEFAAAIVPSMALGLVVGETSPAVWQRWLARGMALVCIWGLIESESRGGLFALLVALAVLAITARGRERVGTLVSSAILLAGVVLALTLTPGGSSLMTRISSGDSTGRSDLWRVAWYEFEDQPLRGVGLGNYTARSAEYLRPSIRHTELFVSNPRTTHNAVLEVLAELGVFGLVFFVVAVGGCVGVLMRALRRARTLPSRAAATYVPIGRGLVAAALAAIASGFFLSGQYQELLWIILAAGLSFAAMVTRAGGGSRPR